MMGVVQARRLARFRESQRRVAAADLAATMSAATDAAARVEQIIGLAGAVSTGRGVTGGSDLAARGEFVSRLQAGQIVATVQRDRQADDADAARRKFGYADARAGFAERSLAVAERLDVAAAEQRAALKAPFRRVGA
jgi:hypothetical protein